MRVGTFLKSSGFAAIAAAITFAAIPVSASAQERGGRDRGSWSQGGGQSGQQAQRGGNSGRQGQSWGGGDRQRPQQQQIRQQAPQRPVERASQAPGGNQQPAWRGGQRDNRPAVTQPTQRGNDQRGRDEARGNAGQWRDQPGRTVTRETPRRDDQRGVAVWRGGNDRQNDRRPDDRRSDDRRWDNNRNDGNRWNDNRGWNNNRGNDRPGYRDNRDNNRQWDRRWRDNRQYNWSAYRNSNRSNYRLGTYYAPYRNYAYRRVNIGFRMDSLFFGNRYWINDPWQYRLPNVYGSYRWVRYYDDVLLVDLYSGQVVDVIYDFFW